MCPAGFNGNLSKLWTKGQRIFLVFDNLNSHTHLHVARDIGNGASMVWAIAITAWYGPFDAWASRINPWVEVDITPRRLCCSSDTNTMHYLLEVVFNVVRCFS